MENRYCLAIPMYNCDEHGAQVIEEVLCRFNWPVVIVDDGSQKPVTEFLQEPIFKTFSQNQRLKIIRHPRNLGKGAALRSAIKHCEQNGYTHLLTMDGDGQHLCSELPKLVEASVISPRDLIVGARIFDETVPNSSKFGRHYSNHWIANQTGKKISDSQSGLRVYPVGELKDLHFITKKYNFEFEVLLRSIWKGIDIIDVPVKVYYPPENERISYFNKYWDNTLIVLLNIYFILISLFVGQFGVKKVLGAFCFGMAACFIPTLGIQIFVIAFLSFCLRINLFFVFSGCLFMTALMGLL